MTAWFASFSGHGNIRSVDWDQRVIDMDAATDVATFHVTGSEVKTIGKTVLTGAQKSWPPGKPPINCGIYFAGFPGLGTIELSPDEVSFGAMAGGGSSMAVRLTYHVRRCSLVR